MTRSLLRNSASVYVLDQAIREYVFEQVRSSSIMMRCAEGDRAEIKKLFEGLWPFVNGFWGFIEKQVPSPLRLSKFYRYNPIRTSAIVKQLRSMSKEEGDHAELWRSGYADLFDQGIPPVSRPSLVEPLMELGERPASMAEFFSFLAGTEFVAEEVSKYFLESKPFSKLFSACTWKWGDAHLEWHYPSHLHIDIDLALIASGGDHFLVEQAIRKTVDAFYQSNQNIFEQKTN